MDNSIAAQKRREVRNPKTGRKKTSIACQHCWKSKTRCGVKRPCDRCVRLGHKDCHDRPEATRKRQHTNKRKNISKTNHKNNSKSISLSPSGYSASNGNNNNNNNNIDLPPMISTTPIVSTTPTSLQYITQPQPQPQQTWTTQSNNNNNLDPNYGSKQMKNYNNVSELLIGAGNVIRNTTNNSNKLSKSSNKKRDTKHKKSKKKHRKKRDKKTGKKRKYRDDNDNNNNNNNNNDNSQTDSTISNISNEYYELQNKKRKLNKHFRDEDLIFGLGCINGYNGSNSNNNNNNNISNNNNSDNEIIYWDYQHKEIDPFSDSSHYSTEYDTDKNNDPSPAVIISINKDNNKNNNEIWSHYTFTRGSLSKFVSVDDNNIKNNKKRSRIPLKKMAKSQKDKMEKRDRTIEEDLAAILGPIGMVNNNNKLKNNIKTNTNCNSLKSNVLFKQIPTNNHIFNITQTNNGVLSQMIPIPQIPNCIPNIYNNHQLQFGNTINTINTLHPFNIQHISNNLLNTPPTMTRITSLIPAPVTTNNINTN